MLLTLCIPRRGNEVLLARKKRRFGVGKWNGFGGHVEKTDDGIEAAARREFREETGGVELGELTFRAKLSFHNPDEEFVREVHVFTAEQMSAEPVETEEMAAPEWFDLDHLPYKEMFDADSRWFPLLKEDKNFEGRFIYDENFQLQECEIEIIEENVTESNEALIR